MKPKYARKQQQKKNHKELKPRNPDTRRVQNRPNVKRVQVPRRIQKSR